MGFLKELERGSNLAQERVEILAFFAQFCCGDLSCHSFREAVALSVNSTVSAPRAWLLLTSTGERSYAGNTGYADDATRLYRYDSNVQNHKNLHVGDMVILRDKDHIIGVTTIRGIDVTSAVKSRFGCPNCGLTKLKIRKTLTPKYRCDCGAEFDRPVEDIVPCDSYTAYFSEEFHTPYTKVPSKALFVACPRFNPNMSMQLLDVDLIPEDVRRAIPGDWMPMSVKTTSRRQAPAWNWDELVLVLEYYWNHRHESFSATHPGIVDLCGTLSALPTPGAAYRTPEACEVALLIFRQYDTGRGFAAGSTIHRSVWDKYKSDQRPLKKEVEWYHSLLKQPESLQAITKYSDTETEYAEGQLRYRLHRYRERNSKVVSDAKKVWLAKDPYLRCKRCDFSFKETYGVNFIEAHHRTPISELGCETNTKIEDLMPVCANCHRMLHY